MALLTDSIPFTENAVLRTPYGVHTFEVRSTYRVHVQTSEYRVLYTPSHPREQRKRETIQLPAASCLLLLA